MLVREEVASFSNSECLQFLAVYALLYRVASMLLTPLVGQQKGRSDCTESAVQFVLNTLIINWTKVDEEVCNNA